ncbi:GNAT family N-acetyltransferase [Pallidibacillus pasinlerensis]|uniref:GNAT family N-acetyltransferase n=1 Tax=Pallidibacillus pasinlerensis TaxID=2703818 RepID=A0ABX0AAI3_9BACI|nr:GNAT family N-acetyltransferase [Pallidibacillus pasinlerensis]NCU18430.1 GNAT family N-acetyltransferase [Pallidibacillus pasinlerensis]
MEYKQITNEEELQQAFKIREEVFVKEQGVPLEDEFDEYDQLNGNCEHILVYHEGEAVGTGRVRVVEGGGKLERICILKSYRKLGIGKVIVQGLENIAKEKGLEKVKLHGQTHAEGFYQKLGYETASDEFMEDGIPHYLMVKELF